MAIKELVRIETLSRDEFARLRGHRRRAVDRGVRLPVPPSNAILFIYDMRPGFIHGDAPVAGGCVRG